MRFVAFFLSAIFFFSFCSSQCNSGQVDINVASISELDKLTDIGPARAQYIVDARPYSSVDDLDKAKDIGPARLAKIKEQGLACIGSETYSKGEPVNQPRVSEEDSEQVLTEDKFTSRVIEETSIESQNTLEAVQTESIINLNSDTKTKEEKIVYESRSEQIRKYSIYAFIIFLLVVTIFLLFEKHERTKDYGNDDY
jgi:hypothetical protein